MTIRLTTAETRCNAQRKVILTVPYMKRKLARLVLTPEDEIVSSTGFREYEAMLRWRKCMHMRTVLFLQPIILLIVASLFPISQGRTPAESGDST
jgi:hypothetical protein